MEQKIVLKVLVGVLILMFAIHLWQPEGSFIPNSVIVILDKVFDYSWIKFSSKSTVSKFVLSH